MNAIGKDENALASIPGLPVIKRARTTIKEIQIATAEEFSLSLNDILAFRRTISCVEARRVAMWLAKQITRKPFSAIGRCFYGRDQKGVGRAVRKIQGRIDAEPEFAARVDALRKRIEAGANKALSPC